jgi:GrpB-like predicted nucleotidyltransferase (UPF0157 family)
VDGRSALRLDGSAGDVLAGVVTALRSPREPLEVVDYDADWPRLYEEEALRIQRALGDLVVEIDHMGSTAVPGLAAKPIIDISLGLRTLDLAAEHIAALERLGYAYLGEFGLPGRLYFRKGPERRTHQVHAVEWGGEHWHRHYAFREYLRAHPAEAQRYGDFKRRLAEEVDHDWREYVERKEPFSDALFARAWRWYSQS